MIIANTFVYDEMASWLQLQSVLCVLQTSVISVLKFNLLQIFPRVQWKAFANSSALLCTDTGE